MEDFTFARKAALAFYAVGWDAYFNDEPFDKTWPKSKQDGWKIAKAHR